MECFKINNITEFQLNPNPNLCEISNYFLNYDYCTSLLASEYSSTPNKTETQQYTSNLLLKYFQENPFVSSNFTAERTQLADLCAATNFPNLEGVCDLFLDKSCSACQRSDIRYSTYLKRFCGCRVSESSLGVPIECDAYCDQPGFTARKSGMKCDETICVLDSINISNINSQVSGTQITQICGSNCSKENPCKCFIDVSLLQTLKNDSASFKTYCGASDICYLYNSETGDSDVVTCDSINKEFEKKSESSFSVVVFVICVICVLYVVLLLFAAISSNKIDFKK